MRRKPSRRLRFTQDDKIGNFLRGLRRPTTLRSTRYVARAAVKNYPHCFALLNKEWGR